ncbi:hypothetical protein FRC04_012083 [Tulasnella sp. 424]|nr:hypothetical protein FRC04_012083 [Tulasnella sp. 424]
MPATWGRDNPKLSSQPEAGPSRPRVDKTKTKPQKQYQTCRYFATTRGCYNGDNCRFLHDGTEPPCELRKICRFYAKGSHLLAIRCSSLPTKPTLFDTAGYCLHGSKCWYKHVTPVHKEDAGSSLEEAEPEPPAPVEEITCGICFEVPVQFGLLISRFITPSSQFYPLGDPKRDELIASYKESMAKITCRHEDPLTGTIHQFDHGVDEMMVKYKESLQRAARRHQARYRLSNPHTYMDPSEVVEDLLAELESLSDGPDPLDAFADLNIQDSDVNLEPPSGHMPGPFADIGPDAHWPTEEDLEYVRSLFTRAIRPRESPPFYEIEGLINVRSLPLPNPVSAQSKRCLILRSGEPNGMSDDGKRQLLDLGIKRVFDLRSLKEVQRLSKEEIFIIPGVEIVSVPALVIAKSDQMGTTFQRFECGTDAPFMESYSDIMNEGTASFRTIFEFLRDHLSSGDGLSDEEIAKDYALTRIGLETSRSTLIARFQHLMDDPNTRAGAENAFSSRRVL